MDNIVKWFQGPGWEIILAIALGAILYWLGARYMEWAVGRALRARGRGTHHKDIEKRQKTLSSLFSMLWRSIIIVVVFYQISKHVFGPADLAPLFASAGIIGIALGFGSQSLVQDFLSGVFIISENQYRVGDIVEIEGFSGTVERIGFRSTVIRDPDGNVHYFPNGMVQHVINKTMDYSMARFFIGVAPDSDIDTVIDIINKTGIKLSKEDDWKKKIIEAPEFISVGQFTATNVEILVAGKTQPSDQWSVGAEMRRRLFEEFEKKHIKLGAAFSLAAPPKK